MVGLVSLELARGVRRAIERYNRYRSPESTARLVSIEGDVVRVLFEGSFCETCGLNDWVVDFKYVMEDEGLDAELLEIVEPEDDLWNAENWRIGVYRIRGVARRG